MVPNINLFIIGNMKMMKMIIERERNTIITTKISISGIRGIIIFTIIMTLKKQSKNKWMNEKASWNRIYSALFNSIRFYSIT